MKRIICILIVALFVAASCDAQMNFISRNGNKLMDGNKEFRFVSMNVPNLHVVEDPWWHRVDVFEQQDAVKTIAQMNGKALRIYCFSVRGPKVGKPFYHVNAPGDYNEELFRDFDQMLATCAQHNVRVIIPFVDNWKWWGGIAEWAAFRGKEAKEFYTDSQVKSDFKNFVSYVLNRKNTITGIRYKDDPTIMCWETGNELDPNNPYGNGPSAGDDELTAWTREIAAYIKSIDSRHLVLDGKMLRWSAPREEILNDNNVDIISNHYYQDQPIAYDQSIVRDISWCQGKKPFVLGEFGLVKADVVGKLLQAGLKNKASGMMIWSLRFRNKDGGFYWHHEWNSKDDVYNSYHWTGYPSNAGCEEKQVLALLRRYAYLTDGKKEEALPVPEAPLLLAADSPMSICWRGSVGAYEYVIERSTDGGKWQVLDAHVSEADNPYKPYCDNDTTEGHEYSYRMRAVNSSGQSGYSNVIDILL